MIDEILENHPEAAGSCLICGGPVIDGCDCESAIPWLESKYLKFKIRRSLIKTFVQVSNKRHDNALGSIEWYPKWKRFIFEPFSYGSLVFTSECLSDIMIMLKRLNQLKK